MAAALSRTIRADGIRAKFFSDVDEVRTLIAKDRPSLAILEHDPPRIDGLRTANGKIAFIRIAVDPAQGQAQFVANHSNRGSQYTSEQFQAPDSRRRRNQAASGLCHEIEQCSVTKAPCITLSLIHVSKDE
jgi:hypothetical protein